VLEIWNKSGLSEEPLLMSFALRACARSLGFLMGYSSFSDCDAAGPINGEITDRTTAGQQHNRVNNSKAIESQSAYRTDAKRFARTQSVLKARQLTSSLSILHRPWQ